jgi:hypothetical protein
MKKMILVAFFATLFLTNVSAQERKNVIKMNLWSPVVSTWNFAYERALNEKMSVQMGFAYTTKTLDDTKYRGYQIQPEVKFYLSEKGAPAGFYVAPFARYRSLSLSTEFPTYDEDGFPTGQTEEQKATWNSVGGGLVVGAQWLFAERVAFGLFGGPAFYSHSFKYEGNASEDNFSLRGNGGFAFRSGVTLGIAF